MQSNEPIFYSPTPNPPPTNRHSITSLILGILTTVIFCSSIVIPIPFTSFICAPISFLLGLLALIYGSISLRSIRKNKEAGSFMAWSGIITGGFIFFCLLCTILAFASLFFFAPDTVQPIIENYQL